MKTAAARTPAAAAIRPTATSSFVLDSWNVEVSKAVSAQSGTASACAARAVGGGGKLASRRRNAAKRSGVLKMKWETLHGDDDG